MSRTPDPTKRAAILEAVERLFAEGRFHEVTTDDIAREAGVGKGTIYRHFADKDALVAAAIERGFDQLVAQLGELSAAGEPLRERLIATSEAIASFFRARRPWFMLSVGEEVRCARKQEIHQRRAKLAAAVAAILDGGADQLRADLVPADLAQLLLGLLRTRARSRIRIPVAAVVDLFLDGALAAAPAKRKPRAKLAAPAKAAARAKGRAA